MVTKSNFTHEIEGPWPLHFKLFHWWKMRSISKFASHYTWGTIGVSECKMDVKSTWNPTWHQMDHVSWSLGLIFSSKNHLLEESQTQNSKTMTPRNLTIVHLLCFKMYEDHAWIGIHWNSIWFRTPPHMTSCYTLGPVTILHELESVLGRPLETSFGLSMSWSQPGHSSWLVCEVALSCTLVFWIRNFWDRSGAN